MVVDKFGLFEQVLAMSMDYDCCQFGRSEQVLDMSMDYDCLQVWQL